MDSCKKFKDLLSDYIEGGLDPQTKLQMETHLKECLNCSKVILRLKTLHKNLKTLPKLPVSPDFETVLRTRIRVESGLDRRRRERFATFFPIRNPVFAAATLVILLAITVTVVTQMNKQSAVYPTDAYSNFEKESSIGNQAQQLSNGHVVYFIEKQPVPYIKPDQADNNIQQKSNTDNDSTYFQIRPNGMMNRPIQVNNSRVY